MKTTTTGEKPLHLHHSFILSLSGIAVMRASGPLGRMRVEMLDAGLVAVAEMMLSALAAANAMPGPSLQVGWCRLLEDICRVVKAEVGPAWCLRAPKRVLDAAGAEVEVVAKMENVIE